MILSYRSPLVTLCFRSIRHYSSKKSASSTRYIARQKKDPFSKAAKFLNYKSRAALKLTQIDNEFHIFRPGYSVVDLGFAPGAWTQVAVERTSPNGKVLGVDIIPTNPPKGASAIQANILSKKTHIIVRNFFVDPQHKGEDLEQSYIASEMQETVDRDIVEDEAELPLNSLEKCPVDIVMSDMYVPVETPERFWNNTTNSAYLRMANTTGLVVKDHTSSIVSYTV
jgi:21S rRNA (uridine2791-2'-O)-methyltransferase